MVDTAERAFGTRLWGNVAGFEKPTRIAALVFVAAAILSMSFTQLGFWSIGIIDAKPVYLLLLLGPLAMGALLFGPFTGALLGLFAGAVVFVHAQVIPLDFYEVYFMTPLNTFGLLTVFGGVAGGLFAAILKKTESGAKRSALIVATCIVLSFIASGLVQLNTVIWYGAENFEAVRDSLLSSPAGVCIQALIDAVLMSLLCCIVDKGAHLLVERADDRALLSVFGGWMFAISLIVFMVASAFTFAITTIQAQDSAGEAMESEVGYLVKQLTREGADPDTLLDGYEAPIDGLAAITDSEGVVIASDDEDRLAPGEQAGAIFGYAEDEDSAEFLAEIVDDYDGLASIQTVDDGVLSMDMSLLAVSAYDGGYAIMVRPSEMVYAGRFGVMASSTVLAAVLIVAIALVASRLLNRVVVQRIDETNDSLVKITGGNLGERVSVRDSREFASLSSGINTTVAALKDSIEEAEQRNAQELLTAKAIQESSLPREFPPFPDIDRFDIYASMKTAKEVGGDFYDFFLIGEDKLGFLIADVSGKGIPAALFMMTAKTQIQSYMDADLPLNEAVDAANHQLCIGNDAGMFVTMFACVLDYNTGELSYVNAGHNPPLLLHDGEWEWLKDVSGMPLGLFEGIPYDAYTRQLETGDVLYMYTDGVTEAMNLDGELFGEERLEATLRVYAEMNPRSIGVGVRRAITDFTLDCEQSDDITMLCLKYGVPPEKRAVMILPALDAQLVHVHNFIHEELRRRGAPKSVRNPLDIAAEELFVNVCHYAYPDATPDEPGEVRIGFEYEANPPSLTVSIADDGVAYNPLAKPDASTADEFDSVADVPIGGLGILMAKRSVDEMAYERIGASNVLTFRKGW